LATLEDAGRFMGKIRQRWPHWHYAAELVLIAATTGDEADIERATAQMERALRCHTVRAAVASRPEPPAAY
jgi:hypothetical protein